MNKIRNHKVWEIAVALHQVENPFFEKQVSGRISVSCSWLRSFLLILPLASGRLSWQPDQKWQHFYLEFSCSAQCDYLQWTNILATRGVETLYTCSHSHALEIKFICNSNILPRLCSNINLLFVTVASYTWKCLVLHIVNLV